MVGLDSEQQPGIHDRWSYLWLACGVGLLFVSNWGREIPIAAWLFPVFLMRFMRTQQVVRGILIGGGATIAVQVFMVWHTLDVEPLGLVVRLASGVVLGAMVFVPFIADRVMAFGKNDLVSTLIFPAAWTSLEFFKGLGFGTWGALAYTQYGNLPLMQVVAVTGIWGLSFLIAWFAPVANVLWEERLRWERIRTVAAVFGAVVILVLFYGGALLTLFPCGGGTTCIASITRSEDLEFRFLAQDRLTLDLVKENSAREQRHFLRESRRASKMGAQLVLWQEYAVTVPEVRQSDFIAECEKLAREERIHLVVLLGVFPTDFPRSAWKNKLVWIDPKGATAKTYLKAKPAGGGLEPIQPGADAIPVVDTAFGRVAAVICADQDYPRHVGIVGRAGAGLLLIPSAVWKSVTPLHTRMGIFRALENGCSLVKCTGNGLSAAVDAHGEVLSAVNDRDTDTPIMLSHVPTVAVRTIYSRVGDFFGWLCVVGFVVLAGREIARRRRQ